MPDFDIGDQRRLRVQFKDKNGTLGDPTTVTFKMEEPDDAKTTYVFGVDAEVIKEAVGIYYVDWTIAQSGIHQYEWLGVGGITGVDPNNFKVRESTFP